MGHQKNRKSEESENKKGVKDFQALRVCNPIDNQRQKVPEQLQSKIGVYPSHIGQDAP